MKYYKKTFCLVTLIIVVAAAYFSRTFENMRLAEVVLTSHYAGTLTFKDESYIPQILRYRCVGDIVLEDIYISEGMHVKTGDPIASVFPAALDRALQSSTLSSNELAWYTEIMKSGYQITANTDGYIVQVVPKSDESLPAESVLYKYIPANVPLERTFSAAYDVIVPMQALILTEEADTFFIRYAIPLTGRGEAGQYTVLIEKSECLLQMEKMLQSTLLFGMIEK